MRGQVQGLRARGGFEVDIRWQHGRLIEAQVRSTLGLPCRIEDDPHLHVVAHGKPVAIERVSPTVIEFATRPGAEYLIYTAGTPT